MISNLLRVMFNSTPHIFGSFLQQWKEPELKRDMASVRPSFPSTLVVHVVALVSSPYSVSRNDWKCLEDFKYLPSKWLFGQKEVGKVIGLHLHIISIFRSLTEQRTNRRCRLRKAPKEPKSKPSRKLRICYICWNCWKSHGGIMTIMLNLSQPLSVCSRNLTLNSHPILVRQRHDASIVTSRFR